MRSDIELTVLREEHMTSIVQYLMRASYVSESAGRFHMHSAYLLDFGFYPQIMPPYVELGDGSYQNLDAIYDNQEITQPIVLVNEIEAETKCPPEGSEYLDANTKYELKVKEMEEELRTGERRMARSDTAYGVEVAKVLSCTVTNAEISSFATKNTTGVLLIPAHVSKFRDINLKLLGAQMEKASLKMKSIQERRVKRILRNVGTLKPVVRQSWGLTKQRQHPPETLGSGRKQQSCVRGQRCQAEDFAFAWSFGYYHGTLDFQQIRNACTLDSKISGSIYKVQAAASAISPSTSWQLELKLLSLLEGNLPSRSSRKCSRRWKNGWHWVTSGHTCMVLVGENPASHSYILNKTKAAAEVGINSETIVKAASVSEEELLNLINNLNNDDNTDGLLVQLPLPGHTEERKICNAVSPDKDVDGFHHSNPRDGKWKVAGRSKNAGMPIAKLLHTDGVHENPGEQLKKPTVLAGIVVSAADSPNLITADMNKEGAAIIHLGINRVQDPITAKPKLVGDVGFERVRKKAGYITPFPGGVGPMAVAILMKNNYCCKKGTEA
ncbi:hypothetical protein GH733_005804 [Mirounga leonina]|nr:hypothetical protein GH733_005804 [Mirounga leonina]